MGSRFIRHPWNVVCGCTIAHIGKEKIDADQKSNFLSKVFVFAPFGYMTITSKLFLPRQGYFRNAIKLPGIIMRAAWFPAAFLALFPKEKRTCDEAGFCPVQVFPLRGLAA